MAYAPYALALSAVLALGAAGNLSAAEYDKSLLPKAYGVLGAERLLHPVDMGNWPARGQASFVGFPITTNIATT